jgi:hypothetical protein
VPQQQTLCDNAWLDCAPAHHELLMSIFCEGLLSNKLLYVACTKQLSLLCIPVISQLGLPPEVVLCIPVRPNDRQIHSGYHAAACRAGRVRMLVTKAITQLPTPPPSLQYLSTYPLLLKRTSHKSGQSGRQEGAMCSSCMHRPL